LRERLTRWYWCGVLGELYGSAIETRFVRDIEQVPDWALGTSEVIPRTVQDATFVESRLHSLRTRHAAAYRGISALVLGRGARDWLFDKALDKVQYVSLAIDIHHVFPQKWCRDNKIDDERRESIINKTPLSASTNRIIGGVAPVKYLAAIEKKAQIDSGKLDDLVRTHLVDPKALRVTDFDSFFAQRREELALLVEQAMGKTVQRDVTAGTPLETLDRFDTSDVAVVADEEQEDADGAVEP